MRHTWGYAERVQFESDAERNARCRAKWNGRSVVRNGSDQIGRVLNAWPNEDGSVGLYIGPPGWPDVHGITSDNEHWTILKEQP